MWHEGFPIDILVRSVGVCFLGFPPDDNNELRSYTSALQTVALFGLGLKRFPATLGALIFFVM